MGTCPGGKMLFEDAVRNCCSKMQFENALTLQKLQDFQCLLFNIMALNVYIGVLSDEYSAAKKAAKENLARL